MQKEPKECKKCGDLFTPLRSDSKYCNGTVSMDCLHCGREFPKKCTSKGSSSFCSKNCADSSSDRSKKIKETNLKKYGSESVFNIPEVREKALKAAASEESKKKRVETNVSRYGVTNPAKDSEIKRKSLEKQKSNNGGKLAFNTEKQKRTMLERYGGPSPMASKNVREKVAETQRNNNDGKLAFNSSKQRETMLERYGGHGRLSSPDELKKQRALMKEKYGVETPCELPEFKDKAIATILENHGKLFGDSVISKINRKIAEIIEEEFSVKVEFEKRIDGKVFDLFIPETNVIVEVNPTVTHNSTIPFACLRSKCGPGCTEHKTLSSDYHQSKSLIAMNNGYSLIQFYDWNTEEELLKLLKSKLKKDSVKLSARKGELKSISQKEANEFLKNSHIQGGSKSQDFCYGLFYDDELTAVGTFGKSRFNKRFKYEWIRYAVKENVQIHGGASRIFKRFLKDSQAESVISYVDFDHTTNKTFLDHIGFHYDGHTSPSIVWHKLSDNRTVSQTSLNFIGADRMLGTSYGSMSESGMSNHDIMLKEGFLKVYTSGNLVYSWQRDA